MANSCRIGADHVLDGDGPVARSSCRWRDRRRQSRPSRGAFRSYSGRAGSCRGRWAAACCSAGSCVRRADWRRRRPGWGRCWATALPSRRRRLRLGSGSRSPCRRWRRARADCRTRGSWPASRKRRPVWTRRVGDGRKLMLPSDARPDGGAAGVAAGRRTGADRDGLRHGGGDGERLLTRRAAELFAGGVVGDLHRRGAIGTAYHLRHGRSRFTITFSSAVPRTGGRNCRRRWSRRRAAASAS